MKREIGELQTSKNEAKWGDSNFLQQIFLKLIILTSFLINMTGTSPNTIYTEHLMKQKYPKLSYCIWKA